MQRFIPSRLLIARCTHLWKVSASGKTLLHLALVLGIPFGIMGNPHDGAGLKPGGTQQYKVQPRVRRRGEQDMGAQGKALHRCLISRQMHIAICAQP